MPTYTANFEVTIPEPPPDPGGGGDPAPPADVVFTTGNLYTDAKVTNESAGTIFQFTALGSAGGNGTYPNTIPTKQGNGYRFDDGTVLDGGGTRDEAFASEVTDVTIWDCEFKNYRGKNSSGVVNAVGGAAIRLRSRWRLIRPEGHLNKFSAVRFMGDDGLIEAGRLHANGQYGFNGTSHRGIIRGTEVFGNGVNSSALTGVGSDTGGCKIVHSKDFQYLNVYSHDNVRDANNGGNGLWSDINNLNHIFDGCRVEDNDGNGIFYEVSIGAEIRNCIAKRNGRNQTSDLWPVKTQILCSNSPDVWIHDNTVEVAQSSTRGYYGISTFNSTHAQWSAGNISNGCLGVRNLLVERNTISMAGTQWIAAAAITGTIPSARSADQQCGQLAITAAGSNNRFRNNTVTTAGGAYSSTPYIRANQHITAAQWASFGYS